jgi:tetratricopeptide (TPR) repeat protein
MDLNDFLARLDSGASSVGTIQIEILAYRESYALSIAETEVDNLYNQIERRRKLARDLENLLENIRTETESEKIVSKGAILTTAASLLSRTEEMNANFAVGRYLIQLDKCSNAQSFIDRAQILYKETEDHKKKFPVTLVSAKLNCLARQHDYEGTERYTRELLDDYDSDDFKPIHQLLYRVLGFALLNQGKVDLAIEASKTGLELLDTVKSDKFTDGERATFNYIIGLAARAGGQYDAALLAFEAYRSYARKSGDRKTAATALSEIGMTWYQIGEQARAGKILEDAAQEAEQAGYVDDATRWRATLPTKTEPTAEDPTVQILVWAAALLRHEPPQAADARRLAIVCIRRAVEERDWNTELDARNCLAAAYGKEGKHAQAVAAAREAVRRAANLNDTSREIAFRINLGRFFFDAGRVEDAELELHLAIEKGMKARSLATTTEIRQAISGGLRNAHEILAVILAHKWELKDGKIIKSRNDKLLELLQETRAGNFAGWVAVDNMISKKGLSALHEPLLELRASDVRIEMEVLSKRGELTRLLENQTRARQRFATAMNASGLNVKLEPPIYTSKELQQSLRPGDCLVDLYGLLDHVLVTLLRPSGDIKSFLVKWPEAERTEFLSHWRSRVALEADRKGKRLRPTLSELTPGNGSIDLPAFEIPFSGLIEQLNERFFNELVNELVAPGDPSRLVIVPHHELALFPFWVLADHIRDVRISVAPGTNVYKLISERPRTAAGPRLAIRDPTDSLDYAAIEVANLPGFEVLAANIDEIVRNVSRANILHCAGHGMFNDQNPYFSGVIAQRFAGPEERSFGARTPVFNEELLTVAEVLARTYLPDCYLVTLSACSTGLPRQHPANEFVGLPTAFLIAGARNVIGSLWPVDDAATCLLMREFYAVLVRDNAIISTPSTALAAARDRLRKLTRTDIVEILGKDSEIIPDLDYPYAGPEYTLAFQHFGVD